jgi:OTU domain-containing protein 3
MCDTGNCLFNALSDQLYGNQNEHHKIRSSVIEYMRENASYYKQFIDVQSGGGLRRNPKRKNAGAFSSPRNNMPPTEAEIQRVFEAHLQQMARGGTYGDNMEISAFSAAFGVDVKIYQRDFAYLVSGGDNREDRGVAHIGYHVGPSIFETVSSSPHLTSSIDLGALLVDSKYQWTSHWAPKGAAFIPLH